ncbi:MAG: hypothetical protein LBR37_02445 [Erysipelotrichaceae bacterium]|jgi:RNA polymerase sigma factor (sigma-70 family)|nr:hypothetical protein [Erysipelotrichaceae bacterium]
MVEQISDEYLLSLVRKRSKEAFLILFKRFEYYTIGIIRRQGRDLLDLGIDFNDLLLSGLELLMTCLDCFVMDSGYFYKYYKTTLIHMFHRRRQERYLFLMRLKNKTISLDETIGSDETSREIIETTKDDTDIPQEMMLKECYELLSDSNEELTIVAKDCFYLRMKGYSFIEIGEMLRISASTAKNYHNLTLKYLKNHFNLN